MKPSAARNIILFSLLLFVSCVPAGVAVRSPGNSCGFLDHRELLNMLSKVNIQNAVILYTKDSALAGVCEIAIERGGQPAIFYVDRERNYMFLGSLMEVKTMTNLTVRAAQEIRDGKKVDSSKIPLDHALILGEARAPKRVIVFTDPNCPFCTNLHSVMKSIVAKREDVSFFIKLYPLANYKDSYEKAKSIICNKSLQLLEDSFSQKKVPKTECSNNEVDNTITLAKSLGITATPTIILPDNRLRMGAMSEEELIGLIDGKK